MANIIEIKHSNTISSVPLLSGAGEIAINQKDKKLYYTDDLGAVNSFDLTTAGKSWGLQIYTDPIDFTAGSTTLLPLPKSSIIEADVFVYFNGVWQSSTQWTLSIGNITFGVAIPVGVTEIEIRVFA